jgi:hypothetical protein
MTRPLPTLCAPYQVTKLRRLGLPVPPELLEASRKYIRESKKHCRKVARANKAIGHWDPPHSFQITLKLSPLGYFTTLESL